MGCVAWNLSEDNACGSISHADQRDLFFPVHTALCSYANDAIKQMGNKMVLLRALTNSGLVLSGYPPPPPPLTPLRFVYIPAIVRIH